MSKKANYFSIGIFVVVAFFLGAASFVYLGTTKLHRNTEDILVTFSGTTNGLRLGAKVKAFGVEIGQVKRIMLHRSHDSDEVVIPVLLEIDLDHMSTLMGYRSYLDFIESPRYKDLNLEAYATLQSESILTGLLYVEIVFGEGSGGYILKSERFSEYRSIPTQRTDMEVMLQSVQELAHNIGKIDFSGLIDEVTLTMQEFRTKMNELDLKGMEQGINTLLFSTQGLLDNPQLPELLDEMSDLMQNLNSITAVFDKHADTTFIQIKSTLAQIEETTTQAKHWISPSSAVYQELVDALDQVGDASRSLRVLMEYLERHPNALLTGKTTEEPVK